MKPLTAYEAKRINDAISKAGTGGWFMRCKATAIHLFLSGHSLDYAINNGLRRYGF
jgi:hypothetical protein